MTEFLGTIESSTHDAVFMSAEGMVRERGVEGKCELERASVRSLLFVFHMRDVNDPALI